MKEQLEQLTLTTSTKIIDIEPDPLFIDENSGEYKNAFIVYIYERISYGERGELIDFNSGYETIEEAYKSILNQIM